MTGADRIEISDKALVWARADAKRRDLRKRYQAAKAGGHAAVITKARNSYLSAASSAAGHRRGLVSMCAVVLARGVD